MQDGSDNEASPAGLKSPHVSLTLEHIAQDSIGEDGPDKNVACRDCPVSVWYWRDRDRLFCFCSAMHEKTWGVGQEPVLFCDAREEEVAKLLKNLAA